MKQFEKILKFELTGYLKNKIFVGVTVFIVAVTAIVMFFPRVMDLFDERRSPGSEEIGQDGANPAETEELPLMLVVCDREGNDEMLQEAFFAAFPGYRVIFTDIRSPETDSLASNLEKIKEQILSGTAECAIVMDSPTSYTYYVHNLSMYDSNTTIINEVLQNSYRMNAMIDCGVSPKDAHQILSAQIQCTTESLGKNQMQNFFYTYIMIFALYMVILLYGQMVATNVATEKSSRAMELLVTSARPTSMMFGKVIASCIAGLIQLIAIFGSALLFYNLNEAFWGNNDIIKSIFDMPLDLFGYMLIFFILGFFIYAFLYGAVGSTASKLEDINTSVMPITMLFIAGFFVVVFSMSSGSIDTVLMKVCSFIPFTSPMAMFTRIAMSTVPWYEVLICVVLLMGSVFGIGVLSAKIYRVGVLLYGTPPKIGSILKAVRKA